MCRIIITRGVGALPLTGCSYPFYYDARRWRCCRADDVLIYWRSENDRFRYYFGIHPIR